MRRHEFILTHIEQILSAWERFARSVETAMPPMDSKGLRDHSEHILRTVAEDMQRPQSERQQIAKSLGHGPDTEGDSPAQTHAMTRFVAGFPCIRWCRNMVRCARVYSGCGWPNSAWMTSTMCKTSSASMKQ